MLALLHLAHAQHNEIQTLFRGFPESSFTHTMHKIEENETAVMYKEPNEESTI